MSKGDSRGVAEAEEKCLKKRFGPLGGNPGEELRS